MKKKHNKAQRLAESCNLKIALRQDELANETRNLIEALKNSQNMKALFYEETLLLYMLQDVRTAIKEAKNVMQNLEESRVFITEEFAE